VQIWVDADACPKAIKEILYRAADRRRIPLVLVANRSLWAPPSDFVRTLQVPAGSDVADSRIVEQMQPGDLVITADIPLAAAVIEKGGFALDPRGGLYTEENVQERLSVRNFMDELRGTGMDTGGPASFLPTDKKAFADQLDKFLSRHRNT
jgi:uncharacterized protein YaiI (UPF0178 family)